MIKKASINNKTWQACHIIAIILLAMAVISCHRTRTIPTIETIKQLDLKRGQITLCGKPDQHFGKVDFQSSCTGKVKVDFDLAIELLHSFEYDEAEKVFAKVIDEKPDCAMAYWGVAMCNNHPLWTPPTETELIKGAKAIAIAQTITGKTARETSYIDALASFYIYAVKCVEDKKTPFFDEIREKL